MQANLNMAPLASSKVMKLNYDPSVQPKVLYEAHRKWAEVFADPLTPEKPDFANSPDPGRPLKIGYVSGDLWRHSVAFFLEPILRCRNKDSFTAYCYANNVEDDEFTAKLRRHCDGWREIYEMDDDELCDQIRRDGIDILVDLSGHTARNRLLAFARRAAPVQVSAIGYTATTGMAAMDYRLTDAWCDPPGETDKLHSEKLYRLEGGFNCFTPMVENSPPISHPPCLKTGGITFCSFNNLQKLSPALLRVWSRLLKATPNSRLFLKTRGLKEQELQEKVLDMFEEYGVDRERILMCDWTSSQQAHYMLYRETDIALDSFPYNGVTTTCEALWMGVPVITLAGKTHSARTGCSILSRAGFEVFVAEDEERYIMIACALASRRESLIDLRRNLRLRLSQSSLFNGPKYTGELEAAYRDMWQGWCTET